LDNGSLEHFVQRRMFGIGKKERATEAVGMKRMKINSKLGVFLRGALLLI
jgi:hypothetical protein